LSRVSPILGVFQFFSGPREVIGTDTNRSGTYVGLWLTTNVP